MTGRARGEFAIFLLAVQFLTRLPVPREVGYSPERLAAAARYYPLVGLIVGGLSAGVFWAAHLALPALLAVLLATAAGLLATGAFHEDGLADTVDGVGGGASREAALAIMKDSRLGAYGAAALGLALAIKVAALAALAPAAVMLALIAAHGVSRLSSVLVIATSRYVRDHGTGKPVAGGISGAGLLVATVIGALGLLILAAGLSPLAALAGGGGALAGHLAMRCFFERKLGGYTGDALGAVQQASEIGLYLGVVAWL
ncbi:MAG: adenosylcobinamide-GDP ribazoletransferase [Caulobacterales bacterium]|nr:adenosylcobinamide-GDP ribazoletransferase [Caulobacterales bacterium]